MTHVIIICREGMLGHDQVTLPNEQKTSQLHTRKKQNQDKQKIYLMTCFASTMNSRACAKTKITTFTIGRNHGHVHWIRGHIHRGFRLKKKQILGQDCFEKPKKLLWGKTLQLDSICLFYFRGVILEYHEDVKKKLIRSQSSTKENMRICKRTNTT